MSSINRGLLFLGLGLGLIAFAGAVVYDIPSSILAREKTLGTGSKKTSSPDLKGEIEADEKRFVHRIAEPEGVVDLGQHQTRLFLLTQPPLRTNIHRDGVALLELVDNTQLIITGKEPGITVLYLWFKPTDGSAGEQVVSLRLRVHAPKDTAFEAPKPFSTRVQHFISSEIKPAKTIELKNDDVRLLLLNEKPKRVHVGSKSLIDYRLDDKHLYLQAKGVGATTLTIWFPDVQSPRGERVLSYRINNDLGD